MMVTVALLIMAASSSCDFVHDKDQRELCRALQEQNTQDCDLIADHDKRQFCRGIAKKG